MLSLVPLILFSPFSCCVTGSSIGPSENACLPDELIHHSIEVLQTRKDDEIKFLQAYCAILIGSVYSRHTRTLHTTSVAADVLNLSYCYCDQKMHAYLINSPFLSTIA